MKISVKEVEQLAARSRLDLTVEENAAYVKSLNASLDYQERLKELDTSQVEPAGQVFPIKNVFREDVVQASLDKEIVLANAPEIEDGAFKVPRIV